VEYIHKIISGDSAYFDTQSAAEEGEKFIKSISLKSAEVMCFDLKMMVASIFMEEGRGVLNEA
jgi:hypothetical protein